MMIFETSKRVPKTEKCCCVFKDNRFICANKTIGKRNIVIIKHLYKIGIKTSFTITMKINGHH